MLAALLLIVTANAAPQQQQPFLMAEPLKKECLFAEHIRDQVSNGRHPDFNHAASTGVSIAIDIHSVECAASSTHLSMRGDMHFQWFEPILRQSPPTMHSCSPQLNINPTYMWTPDVYSSNADLRFSDNFDQHVQLFAKDNYTAVWTRAFVMKHRLDSVPDWWYPFDVQNVNIHLETSTANLDQVDIWWAEPDHEELAIYKDATFAWLASHHLSPVSWPTDTKQTFGCRYRVESVSKALKRVAVRMPHESMKPPMLSPVLHLNVSLQRLPTDQVNIMVHGCLPALVVAVAVAFVLLIDSDKMQFKLFLLTLAIFSLLLFEHHLHMPVETKPLLYTADVYILICFTLVLIVTACVVIEYRCLENRITLSYSEVPHQSIRFNANDTQFTQSTYSTKLFNGCFCTRKATMALFISYFLLLVVANLLFLALIHNQRALF